MLNFKKKKSKGFTLLELLVVLAIMAILIAIAVPKYKSQRDKAALIAHQANVRILETAAENYYQDNGQYPTSLDILKTSGYIKEVPEVPANLKNSEFQNYSIDANGNVSPAKDKLNTSGD